MIVSHKHKFIFLHSRKSAGSSITVSLTRYLGRSDIVLGAIHDCIKNGVRPPTRMLVEALRHPQPQAIYKKLLLGAVWKFVSASNKNYYSSILGKDPQHASAANVKKIFKSEWNDYIKFCVVRNPWSKTLSDYFWQVRGMTAPPSFSEFVKALSNGDPLGKVVPPNNSNWEMCAIDDVICVDKVIRFEELNCGLEELTQEVGIDWDGWLPKSKLNSTRNVRLYKDYYNLETKNIISNIYGREIEHFRYEF